ncbi:MAG: hypothetical protein MUC36_11540, partial [Planctomycetes bacterium]|nr:hypothetical protein [Planctomycetota bacterium]
STVPASLSEIDLVGEVQASAPTVSNGLWWHGPAGDWFLAARDGGEAEFAAAICDDPEFVTLHHASFRAARRIVSEDVERNDARLELTVHLDRRALVEVVPDAGVAHAVTRQLAPQWRNAFCDNVSGPMMLPDMLRSCARRLSAVDIGWLIDTTEPAHVESWVFVGADGCSPLAPDELRPAVQLGEDAPLAERLECLRQVSLLVRVAHGDDSTLVRLRPDRLWLLAGLEQTDRGFVHRSDWHLQRCPQHGATAPTADAPHCVAHLRLQEAHWQRWYHPVWFDSELATRILVTPIALAADLVLGPGAPDLFGWLLGRRADHPGRRDKRDRSQ